MKKTNVKVAEKGDKIILTFNPISALKSVRGFDPANSAPKVHKADKGKGSYTRKKKHKNRDGENDTCLCFLLDRYLALNNEINYNDGISKCYAGRPIANTGMQGG